MDEKTKKLPVQYMWWLLLSAYVVYFIVRAAGQMGNYLTVADTTLKQGIFSGLSLVIMAICGLLAYLAGRVLGKKKPGRLFRSLIEVLFWLVTGSLSALRFWDGLPQLTGDLTLLQNALIQTGGSSREILSDTSALYVDLLSLIFSFLGNKESVIIYIQFAIQIVTLVILYFAVRILCGGRITAYTTVLIIAVSARWIEAASSLQPEVIYMLLWSMMLLFFAFLYHLLSTGTGLPGKIQNVFVLISGILCGMLIYYDLLGLLLLPIGIYFLSFTNRLKRPRFLLVKTVVLASGSALGWLVLILRESIERQTALPDSINRWGSRYKILLSPTVAIPEEHLLLLAIIIMFTLFLSISFWFKERQSASIWIFTMLLLCAAIPVLNAAILDYQMWITLIWAILAGVGLQKMIRAGMAVLTKSPKSTKAEEHVIESVTTREAGYVGHVSGRSEIETETVAKAETEIEIKIEDKVSTELVKKHALFEQLKTPDDPDDIEDPDTFVRKKPDNSPEDNNKIPQNLDVDKESVFEKITDADTDQAGIFSPDIAEGKEKKSRKEQKVEKVKKVKDKKPKEKMIKNKKDSVSNNVENKNNVNKNTKSKNTESKINPPPAKLTEAASKAEESRYDTSGNVKYIDNPLPLPPKPVRKGMRYPYKIGDSQMHYDYEVNPDDDYDIE